MDKTYRKQVELLIRCLPEIEKQTCFALKGGTAINLFVQDMPRLSVDIDLIYLPIETREKTLANIETALDEIANNIEQYVTGSSISRTQQDGHTNKLFVEHDGVRIKIEPNTVQRGTVFEIEELDLCDRAEMEFEASATANTVAVPELYGSKITAALDRQHPRDLFDVMILLEQDGITNEVRKAFVTYLASHPRPMHELLMPNKIDIESAFKTQFTGMTLKPVELKVLLRTRDKLIQEINEALTSNERQFLLSLKQGEPNWSLLDIPHLKDLPAIQWKLINIEKMGDKKREESIGKLKAVLKL